MKTNDRTFTATLYQPTMAVPRVAICRVADERVTAATSPARGWLTVKQGRWCWG